MKTLRTAAGWRRNSPRVPRGSTGVQTGESLQGRLQQAAQTDAPEIDKACIPEQCSLESELPRRQRWRRTDLGDSTVHRAAGSSTIGAPAALGLSFLALEVRGMPPYSVSFECCCRRGWRTGTSVSVEWLADGWTVVLGADEENIIEKIAASTEKYRPEPEIVSAVLAETGFLSRQPVPEQAMFQPRSQESTVALPYWARQALSTLWLPPFVSTTLPVCGFL